jgi:hypothetical protein
MEFLVKVKTSPLFGMLIKHILHIALQMDIWDSSEERTKLIRSGTLLLGDRQMSEL